MAIAAGSTLYYSLLYCSELVQRRSIDTLKLVNTLSTTLFDVNEPQVAEKKIHWWHEELSRLANQEARHPDCISVQAYQHNQSSLKACLNILSAAASERYNPLSTEHDLREHIISDYRARMTLFEHALKSDNQSTDLHAEPAKNTAPSGVQPITFQPAPSATNSAEQRQNLKDDQSPKGRENLKARDAMALGLGYCHRLNSLSARIQSGYPVFSDELYQRFNMTPEAIAGDSDAQALLNHTIAQANDALSNSIGLTNAHLSNSHLSNKKKSSEKLDQFPIPLCLHIMCHIREAQMRLWQKKQPNLFRESVALTPLRKFFIAYRCKRRYRTQG